MEDSFLISKDIKDYFEKHDLENVLNQTIKKILTSLPQDPFSALCQELKENSSNIFTIESGVLKQKLNNELKMKLVLELTVSFKGSSQKAVSYPLPFQNKEIKDLSEENPQLFISTFNSHYAPLLRNITVEDFKVFDKTLFSKTNDLLTNGTEEEKKICQCLSNAISVSSILGMSNASGRNFPKFLGDLYSKFIFSDDITPNLGFVLFRTGKDLNTKTKFERFILFIGGDKNIETEEYTELLKKTYQSIKKNLTAGKLGENGLRLNNENTYSPPADSTNDILKLIETIINETEANGKIYYGIDCNASNYFNEDNKTYDTEGAKKPIDSNQLIEYYSKLCSDHPLLMYLEDPIAEKDLEGWKKIIEVFGKDKPNVKISCRRNINNDIEKLNNLIEEKKEEEEKKEDENTLKTTDPKYRSRLINNIPRIEDIKEEMTDKQKKKIEEERLEKERIEKQKQEEEEKKRQEEEAALAAKKGGKKEPPKAAAKVDDKNKAKGKEEETKEEKVKILPLPLKNLSLRFGDFITISQMFEIFEKLKGKNYFINVYDNFVESEQTAITDIGIGCGINNIILNGYTMNNDKMSKIIEYLSIVKGRVPETVSNE